MADFTTQQLRTWVYKDLLVLKNSFTCHPQILRTCKLVNQEASNILYGDNLIDVLVRSDGVYVHGIRCGTYIPMNQTPSVPFTSLVWPTFLRRAQFLQVSVKKEAQGPGYRLASLRSRLIIVGNIIYSFVSFLSSRHRLRSAQVNVDLGALMDASTDGWIVDVTTACFPLRALGEHTVRAVTCQTVDGPMNIDLARDRSPSSEQARAALWQLIPVITRHGLFRSSDTWTFISIMLLAALSLLHPDTAIKRLLCVMRINLEKMDDAQLDSEAWDALSLLLRWSFEGKIDECSHSLPSRA